MKEKFSVKGMSCSACSSAIEKQVSKLTGIDEVKVNLLSNSMEVSYSDKEVTSKDIVKAVEKAGYGASEFKPDVKEDYAGEEKKMRLRVIISLIFTIPVFYIAMGPMVGLPVPGFLGHNMVNMILAQLILVLPVMIINGKYYKSGFKALFKGHPNMDSLIAIGTSAAMVYGLFTFSQIAKGMSMGNHELVQQYAHDYYFESIAVILTLITLGKYLESRAKGKTSEAIKALVDLAPKTAIRLVGDQEEEIPIEQVRVGDLLKVKPGTKVPVDGLIVEGKTNIDESMLTGESVPVFKQNDDSVVAASLNKTGMIIVKATGVGEDTTLARIIHLVEEAQSSKAPIAKLADTISGYFVPGVLLIALIAVIVWLLLGQTFAFALSIGIAVLVISCPCALGLATPTAIMVGTGKGASNGILIKDGKSLETSHKVTTVVLDKTGTITEGKPAVTDVVVATGVNENELIKIAASMEKNSNHPLGEAILIYAEEKNIGLETVKHLEEKAGHGLLGEIGTNKHYVGNNKLVAGFNFNGMDEEAERLSKEGKTPIYIAGEGKVLGVIAVADRIKDTSKNAISDLHAMGLHVIMLTGDHHETARVIQKQVGIKKTYAEVLPGDKSRIVKELQDQGETVAMVGDGINDAPALAMADVGIAIGSGTDVAIESADVVLMRDSLQDVVTAIELSKATIRNIKQNLFWAFAYNTAGIPLAAGVFFGILGWKLNPEFAAAAMGLSSITVVGNALRLRNFKPGKIKNKVMQEVGEVEEVIDYNTTRKERNKKVLYISNMHCEKCVARVTELIKTMDSTYSVDIDLKHKKVTIEYDGVLKEDAIIMALENADYKQIHPKSIELQITNMHCEKCQGRIEEILYNDEKVLEVMVNLETKNVKVIMDQLGDTGKIIESLQAKEYEVTLLNEIH